jgi:hypothetical protein
MTKPLQSTTIAAPGFFGLNTQDSGVTLDNGFALQATNCVIDKFGRIGARKGWTYLSQTIRAVVTIASSTTTATVTHNLHGLSTGDEVTIAGANESEYNGTFTITVTNANTYTYTIVDGGNTAATGTVTSTFSSAGFNFLGMHRFVDIDAQEYFGLWTDKAFYIYNAGILQQAPYSGAQTIEDGNWQAVTLNDSAYLFQEGYEPLYFDEPNGTIEDIGDHPDAAGTAPEGNVAMSAYGRLWVASTSTNKTTLYWSDLLVGPRWNSGTAGSLDISGILVYGNDEITGLGAHNGFLIIFCKKNIIIFGDSATSNTYLDPDTLQLVEVISGVGCVARDSIQNTGTDIVFLSESGLRSLGRTIQEKSQPMRELSKNVRDDIVQLIQGENVANIKSAYSESNAFYLLSFPATSQVYCFDMRAPLQDGAARVTTWNGMDFTGWLAFNGDIYMTNNDGLARYFGYTDNGNTYRLSYFTNYIDFQTPTQTKILKRLAFTVVGATGQSFVAKSAFDYSDLFTSVPLSVRQATIAEYGIAEYNIAEYSGGSLVDNVKAASGGSGSVLQLGLETEINGGALSLQKVDIYVKQGRVI